MSSPKFRSGILQAIDALLWGAFNSQTGTDSKTFRAHEYGVLLPAHDKAFPKFTVSDGGQRAVTDSEARTEASGERMFTVLVTLQIAANWARAGEHATWSDHVETMVAKVLDFMPAFGVIEMKYVDDDPVDVVFQAGASSAGWEISFEVHRFVDE